MPVTLELEKTTLPCSRCNMEHPITSHSSGTHTLTEVFAYARCPASEEEDVCAWVRVMGR